MARARSAVSHRVSVKEPDGHQLSFMQTPGLRALPNDLTTVPPHFAQYAKEVWAKNFNEIRTDEAVQADFEDFCDYHWKHGTKYRNWYAAWRTWARNAVKFEMKRRQTERPAGRRPSLPEF